MKTMEQMKVEAVKYMLTFDVNLGIIFLMKSKGDVIISPKRARLWVEAGVQDIDVSTKEEMLESINIIEKKQQQRKGGK